MATNSQSLTLQELEIYLDTRCIKNVIAMWGNYVFEKKLKPKAICEVRFLKEGDNGVHHTCNILPFSDLRDLIAKEERERNDIPRLKEEGPCYFYIYEDNPGRICCNRYGLDIFLPNLVLQRLNDEKEMLEKDLQNVNFNMYKVKNSEKIAETPICQERRNKCG